MADLSPEVIDEIRDLMARRHEAMIRNLIPSLHPADLADVLDSLAGDDRAFLFDLLEGPIRSDVLAELDQRAREELLEDMEPEAISEIIEHLPSDDAADVVGELDEPVREEVLEQLDDEDAEEIRALLVWDEETAGGLMAAEFICLGPGAGVGDAIAEIRLRSDEVPDPHFVYVQAEDGPFEGAVTLRSLLLAPDDARLGSIRETPELIVPPEMDQEETARQFRQYDVLEAPVVDASGRMLGVITVDDIVDVMEEEADEDLARVAGTGDESVAAVSVLHATRRRLPWLLVGLAGGLLAALALSRYELSLKEVVSLAFFVPVINAMGGNVAMQSSSIAVRGLAVGPGAYRAIGKRVSREFLISLLNGAVCGVLLGLVAWLWLGEIWLGALIAISMLTTIMIATTVGAAVPVLLDRAKIDPALASGPFVTTANDVLGILIYLSLANFLLDWLR